MDIVSYRRRRLTGTSSADNGRCRRAKPGKGQPVHFRPVSANKREVVQSRDGRCGLSRRNPHSVRTDRNLSAASLDDDDDDDDNNNRQPTLLIVCNQTRDKHRALASLPVSSNCSPGLSRTTSVNRANPGIR